MGLFSKPSGSPDTSLEPHARLEQEDWKAGLAAAGAQEDNILLTANADGARVVAPVSPLIQATVGVFIVTDRLVLLLYRDGRKINAEGRRVEKIKSIGRSRDGRMLQLAFAAPPHDRMNFWHVPDPQADLLGWFENVWQDDHGA
jgi:hypothetical protein